MKIKRRVLAPQERSRRRDLFQATGIAILANLALAVCLLFIAIESPKPLDEGFLSVTAATETEALKNTTSSAKEQTPSANDAKTSAAKRGAVDLKQTVPLLITAPSLTQIDQSNESIAMPDPTAFLGRSISPSAFAKLEDQRQESTKNFVESTGTDTPIWALAGLEGSGVDEDAMGKIFKGDRMGDGSNAVVYLDISGSMKGISQYVEYYMKENFASAKVRLVKGCSLRAMSNPFPAALLSDSERNLRTDFYFVCDLQDGESKRVIDALRRFLTSGPVPRRLHIVSFDRAPDRHLSGLLSNPGSSLTMARGL